MVHSPTMATLRCGSTPDVHSVDFHRFKGRTIVSCAKNDQERKVLRDLSNCKTQEDDEVFIKRQSTHSDVFPQSSIMTSQTHSVVILGELSVGKSALCKSFFHSGLSGHNECDYEDPSCDEHIQNVVNKRAMNHHVYERSVEVKGKECRLRILDVNTEKHLVESGDDEGAANLRNFVGNGEACIVAYAVTDKGTYTTAKEILAMLFTDGATIVEEKPVILVGNKCDLVRKRQVSTSEGVKLAKGYNVKFIETSATLNQNVEELFVGIISQIRLRSARRTTLAEITPTEQSRDKNRPLMKRFSSTLMNPFAGIRTRKVTDPEHSAKHDVSAETSKPKGKRGAWKLRRSKTAELRPNKVCQDLSVL